jgi:hypothetical protein
VTAAKRRLSKKNALPSNSKRAVRKRSQRTKKKPFEISQQDHLMANLTKKKGAHLPLTAGVANTRANNTVRALQKRMTALLASLLLQLLTAICSHGYRK